MQSIEFTIRDVVKMILLGAARLSRQITKVPGLSQYLTEFFSSEQFSSSANAACHQFVLATPGIMHAVLICALDALPLFNAKVCLPCLEAK